MIRTIHKIISFPNRVFGPRTIIRLFSKPFRRFLLIIFTVFRFLSPRFVSPRSKLPIPFIPSPLAFPNFFSTRPNFCAFIYLFRRHVEYTCPILAEMKRSVHRCSTNLTCVEARATTSIELLRYVNETRAKGE